MEGRRPITRWTRPAPERELPRACVAPRRTEEDARRAEEPCPDGCIPGGCCLAVGHGEPGVAAWWHRALTEGESAAVQACLDGFCDKEDLDAVADLADECWRAGCPLENPDARSRRGAGVPGCPGFCDLLPDSTWGGTARWRLEGWLRELTGREIGALRRSAPGGWTADDKHVVEGLCEECGCECCMTEPDGLLAEHMAGDALPCPGFCIMAPPRMLGNRGRC